MKRFLSLMLAMFLIVIVMPSPILSVVFAVSFLASINGWFALLFILIIPAGALSVLIMHKLIDTDWINDAIDWI